MRVLLRKLDTFGELGPNPPRTKEMEGYADFLPKKGKPFLVIGESLENPEADHRAWQTSPVVSIAQTAVCKYRFTTANSIYELEVRDE